MRSPFIVAELSCNHLGNEERAHALVEAAKNSGADAVKVQVWSPDTMVLDKSIPAPKPWSGTLFELYRECWTPWDWLPDLFLRARQLGLVPFGAAFDAESVDYLESLGVDRHKIASNEITDIPLIRKMAATGKPVYLSSGAASIEDLSMAIRETGQQGFPLACIAQYPADASESNLLRWTGFNEWGISDHTEGHGVAVAAVALGATYVEKHFTLSRADGGPDASFSLEPAEFAAMATACRQAHAAIQRRPERAPDVSLRRSLWVTRPIKAGEPIMFGHDVRTARPNLGLPCDTNLEGAVAARDLRAGEPLTAECIT